MKKSIFHNALSPLLMCSFILSVTSCADDDLTYNQNNGALVHFNVNDVQESAISRGAQTRGAITPGLGSSDLAGRKLAARCNRNIDVCLIETTVEGVDPVKADTRTRANIITDATLGDFSASGIRGVGPTRILTTPEWFHAEKTKKTGELYSPILWTFAQPYARFFAVYPNVESYSKMTVNNTAASGSPSVEFEVETDVTKEVDLMTACSGNVRYATLGVPPETNLNFRHALTGIRFAVGQNLSWNKTIDRVELQGVLLKSKYVLSKELDGTGAAWDHTGYTTRGNAVLSGVSVSTSQNPNVIIMGKNADNYTFYMIPQELTGHVTAYVHFTDGTTITVPLKGKWKAGTTRTYKISQTTSSWQYTLTVQDPSAVAYNQTTTGNYGVTSFREDPVTHQKQAVLWQVVGYDANGDNKFSMEEKPAWLTNLSKTEGAGGIAAETGFATITTASLIDRLAPYNQVLKDAEVRGTISSPYDLSIHDYKGNLTAMNTANSYLISAPGYYCIPLVYGNAIENGITNSHSYQTTISGTYVLKNFKDHADKDITSPYINVQNSTDPAVQASIVWTDQSGIVESSSLSVIGNGSNSYVKFHVPANKIRNGNAVIAVKNASGTIMWSWHLWFDHDDVLNTIPVVNHQGMTYNFTKQTLGFAWIKWEESTYTKPRVVRVKVEQPVTNGGIKQFAYITIMQNPGSAKQISSTIYQFGRKDALPGVHSPSDGSYSFEYGNRSLGYAIQHPETMFKYTNRSPIIWDWSNATYHNLWSMDNKITTPNDNVVVKTIYDPCPVGLKIPAPNAFTGFTTTGKNESDASKFNVSGAWDMGYNFRTTAGGSNTIYFPASVCRTNYNGRLDNTDGNAGIYWSATPARDVNSTYELRLYQSYVLPLSIFEDRAWGYNVRPVSE